MPRRVERRIEEFNHQNKSIQFTFTTEQIDSQKEYFEHVFFNTGGITPTVPTNRMTLICNK